MKKIPTIFERDEKTRKVIDIPHGDCAWVFEGQGVATEKLNGTNIRVTIRGHYVVRIEKRRNPGAIQKSQGIFDPWYVDADPNSSDDQWICQAVRNTDFWTANEFRGALSDGEYSCEALGPHIQGNPLGLTQEIAVPLCSPPGLLGNIVVPRTFDGLEKFLREFQSLLSPGHIAEGIVFHHPDGRRAKIKRKDF